MKIKKKILKRIIKLTGNNIMKCSAIKVILLAPSFYMLKATKVYANFVERVENGFCLPND